MPGLTDLALFRIQIISPAWPLRGGIASFTEILASELSKAGHQVGVISYSLQYPSILFPGKSQYTDDPRPENLHIKTLINSIWPPSWFRAADEVISQNAQLVVIRYWMPFFAPALGIIASRVKRKLPEARIICIADNAIPHEKRPGDIWLSKFFFSKVDEFLTMSSSVAEDLYKIGVKCPVRVTYHPVYNRYGERKELKEARKKLGLDEHDKVILFFGFIRRYKGLELLLRAMAEPALKDSGIKLMVAGEFYESEKETHALVESLGIKERVFFYSSFIPDAEVSTFFSAANLLVQPYLSATQSGITQIAFHFGLPMVVTAVGGLPEMVENEKEGFVCETNPMSVSIAVSRYFDENREADFTAAVLKKAIRYSWDYFIETLLLQKVKS